MGFFSKFIGISLIGIVLLGILTVFAGYKYVLPIIQGPPQIELQVDSGVVEVLDGDWKQITKNTNLKQGDSVRTENGEATIVFFGSTIMRLDANTEVKLTEANKEDAKIIITLANGRTWNRVIKATDNMVAEGLNLKGIREYEVQMPNAVATVRGTSFSTDSKNIISVVTGKVNVKSDNDEKLVEMSTAKVEKKIEILPLDENDPWLQANKKKDSKFDDDLIAQIRAKYWPLIQLAKQKYGLTNEEIDQGIRDYLAGKLDEDKLKRIEEIDS